MKVIHARNVSEALPLGVHYLLEHGERCDSRAGPVFVSPVPVTTVYEKPTERVVLSSVRDANPFFHVAESMWMLCGRNDSEFLNTFIKSFGEKFGEDDGTIHGAYGHRWRRAFGFDQLDVVVEKLRANPDDRQCVISMWDPAPEDEDVEGYDIGWDDLRGDWKDRPCNTQIYLRVRGHRGMVDHGNGDVRDFNHRVLDMTVTCRSNDIVLGAYGANAVHFSFLQEYLAARIGVEVGTYYQFSNNYHMYDSEMDRLMKRIQTLGTSLTSALTDNRVFPPVKLVDDPVTFDQELRSALNIHARVLQMRDTEFEQGVHSGVETNRNRFIPEVLWPMLMTHYKWNTQKSAVFYWSNQIQDEGWRTAVQEWMQRRTKE